MSRYYKDLCAVRKMQHSYSAGTILRMILGIHSVYVNFAEKKKGEFMMYRF